LTRSLVAGAELPQPLLHAMVLLAYATVSYDIAVLPGRGKLPV
jgi:hypothetical protein